METSKRNDHITQLLKQLIDAEKKSFVCLRREHRLCLYQLSLPRQRNLYEPPMSYLLRCMRILMLSMQSTLHLPRLGTMRQLLLCLVLLIFTHPKLHVLKCSILTPSTLTMRSFTYNIFECTTTLIRKLGPD